MQQPLEKSVLAMVIDFVIGAIAGDIVVCVGFFRGIGRIWTVDWHWLYILLLAATLIAGSLAALFRNQFWSGLESYSIIPPIEETVPRKCKPVLWALFALGCLSLGLFFIPWAK